MDGRDQIAHNMTSRGYTLVELLVVMAIGIIIVSALLYFFSGSITSYRSQVGHIFATADARNQLQRIVDTLRNAQDSGSTAWLAEAEDNAITVWTDISGDGVLEKVRYVRSGTELQRIVDTATTTVATRLDSNTSVFTYYDTNGSAIVQASDRTSFAVKTVGISITLAIPESTAIGSQTVATRVTPRQKLQGTISRAVLANGNREVTIELPRGTPPVGSIARLVIQNTQTGATVVNKDISIVELNDGRIRSYATNDYAMVNYKNISSQGISHGWYVWLTWGVPVQQMSGAVPLQYFYTNFGSSKAHCLGRTLSVALAASDCAAYTYPWGVPYQPILTYSENEYKDHVMDIYIMRPILTSFTSTTANGTYGPGTTIVIRATYDEAIKSGSTLTVVLDTGKSVALSTVSGSTVSGTYTVGATGSDEDSNDLNVRSITSEAVSSTTTPARIRTNSTIPSGNNLADTSAIVVDTTAPAAPTADPLGGTYSGIQTVTLSGETGATIYYTTNGSNPTVLSSVYSSSSPLSITPPTTLKAIAKDVAGNSSPSMTEKYKLSFINGANAIDLIGQYVNETDNPLVPKYDKNAINDGQVGVNKFGFSSPYTGILIDTNGNRLFISDGNNNRVLVYILNSNNTLPDKIPDYVLGQNSFTTNGGGTTPKGMQYPRGLAYNSVAKKLFVADYNNNRVLVYNVTSITNGQNAVNVLGQTGFGSSGINRMWDPSDIAYDSSNNRLFVVETGSDRVTVYNTTTITNGQNAVNVLGASAVGVLGTGNSNQNSLYDPSSVAYDTSLQRLFVGTAGDGRVVMFDVAAITNNENAINVLGQTTFGAGSNNSTQSEFRTPRGLAYDSAGNRLFIATDENRVLVFNVATITNGQNAVGVLGSSDFNYSFADTTQSKLNSPTGLVFDATNNWLYVADTLNNRVMIFNAP